MLTNTEASQKACVVNVVFSFNLLPVCLYFLSLQSLLFRTGLEIYSNCNLSLPQKNMQIIFLNTSRFPFLP